ncbi:uncharacterized protein LOC126188847 isoform X1 [Schistocerca cancellata]|uniref:uncharacterized protein LOC126188847 isoform X1 n=1 Tax=Schistocerca cancellata TaxID=274614 RepID=UPI0021192CA4|nr:uncharacterized protein LOC126188847 isoform X1 [Schistocerca cancellata]
MKLVYFLVLYCSCISVNAHPPWVCNETELAASGGPTEDHSTYPTNIVGVSTKANVSDPIIKNISAFALPTIDSRLDGTFKIARIVSAEFRSAAGTLYYLQLEVCTTNSNRGEDDASSECIQTGEANKHLCDVLVWDRPWRPEREVTALDCTAINARRKREVFAETLYHLQIEVGDSTCDKRSNKVDSECTLREGSSNQVCTVNVWDRLWLNKREVTQVDCSAKSARRRQTIPGGLADADVSEEGVRKAAEFALTEIDKRSNSAYKQTLVQILNAQKQDAAEVRSISFKAADLEEH